jgi:hypothetical protein
MTVNGCTLSKLSTGGSSCGSNCFPPNSEEACLCFALYTTVNQALCGDPLAVSKTKVGSVKCGSHNGMFFINYNTKGTVSAVRKSIGMALKVLDPAKMNSAYSRLVKECGSSPSKESFAHVASAAASGIKSDLCITIVGNINFYKTVKDGSNSKKVYDKAKFDGMMDVLSKKRNVTAVTGSKSKPSDHTPCDHSLHTEVKTSGWSTAVLVDFIRYKLKGLVPVINDKYILVAVKPSVWDTASKKLKPSVKDYISAKFTRVGDSLPEVFGYLASASCTLGAHDIKSLINSKVSASSLESAITKAL